MGLRTVIIEAGLGFMAGPGGKRLTQGQRQKIALARALLKKPDVMVVNRGLGALSPRTQRSIMQHFADAQAQTERKTRMAMFWVLASPALIDMFDRVVVFHDGRISGDGKPDQLLTSNKHLKRLVA